MSTLAKILVVVNALLAGGFLASAGNYLGNQDTEKAKRLSNERAFDLERGTLQQQLSEANERVRTLNKQLTTANADKATATTSNNQMIAELASLKEAYASLAENHTVQTRFADRATETLQANRNLITQYQESIQTQRQQIATLQEDRNQKQQILNAKELGLDRAQTTVKDQEQRMAQMAEKLRQAEFQLAFFQDRFPGVLATTQPAHDGRILYANNDANVFTISLGTEDGVRPGFVYTIARGSSYVAEIQIDDVQAKKASGFSIRDKSKGPIQVGDSVFNAK